MPRKKPRQRRGVASRKPDASRRLRIEVLELRTVLSSMIPTVFVAHEGGPTAISLSRLLVGPLPEIHETRVTLERSVESASGGTVRSMAVVQIPKSGGLAVNITVATQPSAWGHGELSGLVVIPGNAEQSRFVAELSVLKAEPIAPADLVRAAARSRDASSG